MNQSRLIYYVGFPVLMIFLCGFSYYLGFNRGQQLSNVSETQTPAESSPVHETGEDLTFFKTLKEDAPSPKVAVKAKVETKATPKPESRKSSELNAPSSPKGGHVIQVSAFKDIGRAHELIDLLKNRGFQAYGEHRQRGSQDFHRVFVGPFPSREAAEVEGKKLATIGFPDHFVTKAP